MMLDATVAVIDRDGYGRLTVAAIAAEAGVTRPTVYANFGTLAELVSIAVSERALLVLGSIAADIDAIAPATDYAIEFIVAGRNGIRSDGVLTQVLYAQTDSRLLDTDVVDRGIALAGPLFDAIHDRAPWLTDDREAVDELLVRISLSAIIFVSRATESDDGLRQMLRRWIDPLLAQPGSSPTS